MQRAFTILGSTNIVRDQITMKVRVVRDIRSYILIHEILQKKRA